MIQPLSFEMIPELIRYIRTQHDVFGFSEQEAMLVDQGYLTQLIGACYDSRKTFISVKNGKVNGFCAALVMPNVWVPARKELHLLAVKGDNNFTATKMFLKFMKEAEKGLEKGLYWRILVDEIITTNLDYEKLGFKPLRKTYTMER